MNNSADHDRLLNDVLAEGTAPGFREALLGQTLRLARRRRRFRQARRAASVLAAVAVAVFLVWRSVPPTLPPQSERPYTLVRTQPLLAAIVGTTPLGAGHVVSSAPAAAVVTTQAAHPSYREIDDNTLLALAAPNAAVLIRYGPHSAELVFPPHEGEEVGDAMGAEPSDAPKSLSH